MKFIYAALVATVSAECMKDMKMSSFVDKECTKPYENKDLQIEKVKVLTKEELDIMNSKCAKVSPAEAAYWKSQNFEATSMKVTCDAKEFAVTVYKDENCKGDTKSMEMEWKECKPIKMGSQEFYVQVTGAYALQAAAAAALAFVGSQF